jgi:hypothetical protein
VLLRTQSAPTVQSVPQSEPHVTCKRTRAHAFVPPVAGGTIWVLSIQDPSKSTSGGPAGRSVRGSGADPPLRLRASARSASGRIIPRHPGQPGLVNYSICSFKRARLATNTNTTFKGKCQRGAPGRRARGTQATPRSSTPSLPSGLPSLPSCPPALRCATARTTCSICTCSAIESALQPPALATEGPARQRAARARASIVRLCMLVPSRQCIGCDAPASAAQQQARRAPRTNSRCKPFSSGLRWLQAAKPADGMLPACGVIAPHAGYSYSVRAAALTIRPSALVHAGFMSRAHARGVRRLAGPDCRLRVPSHRPQQVCVAYPPELRTA